MAKKTPNPVKVSRLLWQNFWQTLFRKPPHFKNVTLPDLSEVPTNRPHSIFMRHLDCGSCNGCEMELNALANPVYDIAQYGIHFEASPRHADVLAMTGPYTRNLNEAALLTLEAMPEPRIITIGDCAKDGGDFKGSYGVMERPGEIETAIEAAGVHIPGCPPTPEEMLKVLLKLPPELS